MPSEGPWRVPCNGTINLNLDKKERTNGLVFANRVEASLKNQAILANRLEGRVVAVAAASRDNAHANPTLRSRYRTWTTEHVDLIRRIRSAAS
jgi:hypothetical protein